MLLLLNHLQLYNLIALRYSVWPNSCVGLYERSKKIPEYQRLIELKKHCDRRPVVWRCFSVGN